MLHCTAIEAPGTCPQIRPPPALVLLIADLLDLPTHHPRPARAGGDQQARGRPRNKIDLPPGDSPATARIKQLIQYCQEAGFEARIMDAHPHHQRQDRTVHREPDLQPAEVLEVQGDVYSGGSANAGKFFNTLLESGYCKSKAPDVIHKATISLRPGNNLLVFSRGSATPRPHHQSEKADSIYEKHGTRPAGSAHGRSSDEGVSSGSLKVCG
ncbi:nitric oxide-associated protein 1 [Lates japonicus]|uniref:Nitric oxide-associated protein 1 n=1 Tax=Lates japonicus TaxID=270547 RepID=A0AAD3NAK0_LATJO|nr:nitric oxide-associated protein 1 [Lates japonicus]